MVEHTICRENSTTFLDGEKDPKEFKEIWKDVSLRLILEDKNKRGYHFVGSNLGIEIFLKKGAHHEQGMLK